MIEADETFDGRWPFKPHFFEGNGFRQHYVDEGDGEAIVCVHGEPTWGYLYRYFVRKLSEQYRVVVPDHMGFGKSETPPGRDYSIRAHSENLERLLLDLDIRNATLVLQDWGGPIGSSFAIRHPERVKCLCLCNTTVPWARVPKGTRGVGDHYWFKWVNSEEFAPVITHLGSTVLSVMKRIGFENTAHIDETWVRAYAAPFPTVDSCRGALQFPRNIASRETFDFYEELSANHDLEAFKAIPAMYVHGEEDRAIPTEWAVTAFRTFWPNAPLTTLPGVGHFLQEDAPQTVCALVEQFVQTCG